MWRSLFIAVAHAAPPPTGLTDGGCNFPTGDAHFACIPVYISQVTFAAISFSGSLALVMLIYNGFRYMIGPVTEGSSDAAKKGILYSIIGLVVALLTYAIIDTIITNVTPP